MSPSGRVRPGGGLQARRLLARKRRAVGFTQESLAERLGVDRSTIARWERGSSDPQPSLRLALADALGVSMSDLDSLLADGIAVHGHDPHPVAAPDGRGTRDRSDELTEPLADALVSGSTFTGSAASAVMELRLRLDSLRELDKVLGGADTYRLYAAEVQFSAHLLSSRGVDGATAGDVLALLAEQSQQAGWAAFDAGWRDVARRHYERSLSAAREVRDLGLVGNALALLAYQRVSQGRPAGDVSQESLRVTSGPEVDGRVRAMLLSRAAWTFALAGDVDAMVRALRDADELLGGEQGEGPRWATWLDSTEAAIMAGRCWSQLGRPLRAIPLLESALAAYASEQRRDKALYSTWLADAYIDAGEIEKAVDVLRSTIDAMSGVASVRPRERLTAVSCRLEPHRRLAPVRELLADDAFHPGLVGR